MPTLARIPSAKIDDSWINCWDRRAAAAPPPPSLTLDPEAHNSPLSSIGYGRRPKAVTPPPSVAEVLPPSGICRYTLEPWYSGGLLDPEGGCGKRIAALKRFEALSRHLRRVVLITLTVDRKRYATPEDAHKAACRLLSKFLSERLGIAVWARVLEIQTKSGEGWPHWHVLAELRGTRWAANGGWLRLREFSARCWEVWRDEMGMGSVRVDLIKSAKGTVGYVVKYVNKVWPAFPTWILDRERAPRVIGFSKAASAIIRKEMGLPEHVRRTTANPRPRRSSTVLHRLAASGLRCKVMEERVGRGGEVKRRAVGWVVGRWEWFVLHHKSMPDLRLETEQSDRRQRLRLVVERGGLGWIRSRSTMLGFGDRVKAEYAKRRRALAESWERMQAERGAS